MLLRAHETRLPDLGKKKNPNVTCRVQSSADSADKVAHWVMFSPSHMRLTVILSAMLQPERSFWRRCFRILPAHLPACFLRKGGHVVW